MLSKLVWVEKLSVIARDGYVYDCETLRASLRDIATNPLCCTSKKVHQALKVLDLFLMKNGVQRRHRSRDDVGSCACYPTRSTSIGSDRWWSFATLS